MGAEYDYPEHDFYLPAGKPRGGEPSEEEKSYSAPLSAVRIVVEHSIARMSRFGALSQVFGHRRGRHSAVVRVGAFLVDRQIAARQAAPAALALAA